VSDKFKHGLSRREWTRGHRVFLCSGPRKNPWCRWWHHGLV